MQKNKNSLSNLNKANYTKTSCKHCDSKFSLANINKHERSCSKNPICNKIKECPVCKIIHTKAGVTCSYSCSNVYFRSGKNNPNWKGTSYRFICFAAHGKKCVVCGENKIVAVHHLNENHNDNAPENLIPLCPTHHQYMHSRYKKEIQKYIDKFLGVG